MEFITQPFAEIRLGEFLLSHLADPQWSVFRAAIAFVKRSGTRYIREPLRDFSTRAQVRLSLGVDLFGTSREGLSDLLEATSPNGQIFIYRNNGPYTFHPKVYLFKSTERADIIVGSGNLTGGGLFTNYEASLVASLDLTLLADANFLQAVEGTLDLWSQPLQGVCYALTAEFLDQLVGSGLVRGEAQLAAMQQARTPVAQPPADVPAVNAEEAPPRVPLFVALAVPPAPAIAQTPGEPADTEVAETTEIPSAALIPPPGIVTQQIGGVNCFVMTLQNTDVGVGQTTAGTSRRSPEVFIPLAALDQNPAFWTFPTQFTADTRWNSTHSNRRNGFGKMDRMDVPMRIGTVQSVRMFFNPRKGDFRLGNEALRSSGQIGDILLVRRVDPVNGFEYDIQVAPQGSPLFQQLAPFCNIPVSHSQKLFGYF